MVRGVEMIQHIPEKKTANINLEIDLETGKISDILLIAMDEKEVEILMNVLDRCNLSIEVIDEVLEELPQQLRGSLIN
jgi:hypothetical protein